MILKKLNPFLLCCVLLFLSLKANAFDSEEASVYAGFIKSIVQNSQGGNGKSALCVFGMDEISKIIVTDSSVIDVSNNIDKSSSCRIIYVANDKRKTVKLDIAKFNSKKILTIATFDGFIESGGILQVEMGRRNFELVLNTKLAKEFGIKLSSLVMDLVIN